MMRRREFVTLIGGAAAWPITAQAQQSRFPVIGYISGRSPESDAFRLAAFGRGLNETGYVEGRNVGIEYRGMQGHYDLLPAIIADFVRRPVAVIVVDGNTPGVLAAKAATATIPIVFNIGVDPVDLGIVASLNRPGGNITGISNLSGVLAAKKLELLRELMPGVSVVAFLSNPSNAPYAENEVTELQKAADVLGLQLRILNARTIEEIDMAFAALSQVRAGALLISGESFFASRLEQLGALSARHAVPTMCTSSEFTTAGCLMSYGPIGSESVRLVGVYAGRILKGEGPADLPVQQSTKVELIINLRTAKALGLTVPLSLRAVANEVIE
jgi:putative ABC transport system substrate-binding protein